MNQKVLYGSGSVDHSNNGLQGMAQKKKSAKNAGVSTTQQSGWGKPASASTAQQSPDVSQMTGVDCDIADGSRRVARWLFGENVEYDTGQWTEGLAEESTEEAADQQTEEKNSKSTGMDDSSIQYLEQLLESMRKSREESARQKTNQKRAVNYNYRKVSGAIMRAKSITQAGNALTSANAALSNLQRKSGSGEYDSNELGIAISHARKMVRAARKKLQNMKLEERQSKADRSVENNQEREHQSQKRVQRGNHTAENAWAEKELLRLKEELKQSRNQKKNAHRRDENSELLNADMEYLKRKIELMRQERSLEQIARLEAAALQQAIAGGAAAGIVTTGNGGGAAETAGGAGETGASEGVSGAEVSAATASGGFDQTV